MMGSKQAISPEEYIKAAARLRRRGMKKVSIKGNDYILEEMNRVKKDIGAIMDTYFTLGSRLNKKYKEVYEIDYTRNEHLNKTAFDLMGARDAIVEAIDEESNGTRSFKDIENNQDRTAETMADLIGGIGDELSTILALATKVGDRKVIEACEALRDYK